jgi:hypothetical protein
MPPRQDLWLALTKSNYYVVSNYIGCKCMYPKVYVKGNTIFCKWCYWLALTLIPFGTVHPHLYSRVGCGGWIKRHSLWFAILHVNILLMVSLKT